MKNSANFPRFITIEGCEGAGKSTLINQLEAALMGWGFSVVKTREPGGSALGEQIRTWLLTQNQNVKICNQAELLLFLAARAQHIEEVIRPAIESNQIVLCDRFNDSTIAYQGAGRHSDIRWIETLCLKVCGKFLPDLTIFLDVDPAIGLQRTKKAAKQEAGQGQVDRIEAEKLEFHQRVREAFLAIGKAHPQRFHAIDANGPQAKVSQDALELIERFFVSDTHHV